MVRSEPQEADRDAHVSLFFVGELHGITRQAF
jgi:hypothetical protein